MHRNLYEIEEELSELRCSEEQLTNGVLSRQSKILPTVRHNISELEKELSIATHLCATVKDLRESSNDKYPFTQEIDVEMDYVLKLIEIRNKYRQTVQGNLENNASQLQELFEEVQRLVFSIAMKNGYDTYY